jgi:hypothetical protein
MLPNPRVFMWTTKKGRCDMMKRTMLVSILVACLGIVALTAFAADLTGIWSSDSGGSYYIRQLQNEVWWYGEASPTNPDWSNVANGTLRGKIIQLKWSDVPKGSILNNGTLTLELTAEGKLVAKKKTGDFADSEWTRRDN